jgi:hypothetical protein
VYAAVGGLGVIAADNSVFELTNAGGRSQSRSSPAHQQCLLIDATSGVVRPKEAAQSIVTKIVKMEILKASPPPDALSCQPEGFDGNTHAGYRGSEASTLTALRVSTT